MPRTYIKQTRDTYDKLGFKPYEWFKAESPPAFTPPKKKLSESRLGLVSTAGTYVTGQVAYHFKDDTSIRAIPSDTPVDDIRFSHIMQNYLVEARQDPCTVFPLEALAQLRDDGLIGELASNFFSCMGGIYSQARVASELLPNLETAIEDEQLDLLLLIPL